MPAKGPLGSSGRAGGGGGSAAGARGGRVTGAGKPSARSLMATTRAKAKAVAKQAPSKPKTLYHGTSTKTPLKKGDRLHSGSGATTNYGFAKSYATGRASAVPSLSGKPRVLEVKPSKTMKPATSRTGSPKWAGAKGKNEWNDPAGFKVVGKAKKPTGPKMKTSAKPNPKPRKGNQR